MAGLRVRRERRQSVGRFKIKKAEWIDPFPWIPGTHPEKLLFASLVARRIYFIFQGDFPITDRFVFPLLQDRNFKPDFVVPEWKIIYDPYGDFAHSRPESIGTPAHPGPDVWKQVYYEGKGYEFIHPWSSQIETLGPEWMIDLSTRIHHPPMFPLSKEDQAFKRAYGYRLGPNLGAGATGTAAANHARAKPKPIGLRAGRRRRTKT